MTIDIFGFVLEFKKTANTTTKTIEEGDLGVTGNPYATLYFEENEK